MDCVTKFEAAGSVVTVKRSPVSKRVKARDTAKGIDILSSGQSKPPLERDSVSWLVVHRLNKEKLHLKAAFFIYVLFLFQG